MNRLTTLKALANIVLIASLFFTFSCQKEEYIPNPNGEGGHTITAIIEGAVSAEVSPPSETKNYLNTSNWKPYWKTGDKISLTAIPTSGDDVVNKSFSCSAVNENKGTFTEDVLSPATTWPVVSSNYITIYPYSAINSITGTGAEKVINLTYPNTQGIIHGESGDFSCGVMMARINGMTSVPDVFTFSNLFSIIKLSITSATARTLSTVIFEDLSGKPVSGAYTINVASGAEAVFPATPANDNASSIILTLPANTDLSSTPTDIYIAVPARTYPNGFGFKFTDSDGKVMVKSGGFNATLVKGNYYNMTVAFTETTKSTANCYMVAPSSSFTFNAEVKGNFSRSNQSDALYPKSAKVLWETGNTVGGIISACTFNSLTKEVTLTTTSTHGNAVIAVYDNATPGSGNILWSWHIWVTDYTPATDYDTYPNSLPSANAVVMDRNLGTISNTPGDVGALGFLYQWGRKDPFRGGGGGSITENTFIPTAGTTWPTAVTMNTSTGTVAFATKNPQTFISSGGDWLSTPNNNQWSATKTIYDPCPDGWRVPDKGIWNNFVHSTNCIWNTDYQGYNYTGGTPNSIWYPTSGYINGSLYSIGIGGNYWSNSVYYLGFRYDHINTSTISKSFAFAVRCQKE